MADDEARQRLEQWRQEWAPLSDEEVMAQIVPGMPHVFASVEMQRRHVVALRESAAAASRARTATGPRPRLTGVLVALTIVLVVLTVALLLHG